MCAPRKLTLELTKFSHLIGGALRLQIHVPVFTWVGGFEDLHVQQVFCIGPFYFCINSWKCFSEIVNILSFVSPKVLSFYVYAKKNILVVFLLNDYVKLTSDY